MNISTFMLKRLLNETKKKDKKRVSAASTWNPENRLREFRKLASHLKQLSVADTTDSSDFVLSLFFKALLTKPRWVHAPDGYISELLSTDNLNELLQKLLLISKSVIEAPSSNAQLRTGHCQILTTFINQLCNEVKGRILDIDYFGFDLIKTARFNGNWKRPMIYLRSRFMVFVITEHSIQEIELKQFTRSAC